MAEPSPRPSPVGRERGIGLTRGEVLWSLWFEEFGFALVGDFEFEAAFGVAEGDDQAGGFELLEAGAELGPGEGLGVEGLDVREEGELGDKEGVDVIQGD
jgi:hypothetical protein